SEAEAGRLFFINTGADGGYPTDIYVDETPDSELLEVYTTNGREFLIRSESGRLIAGGLEDYGSDGPQITSQQDEFAGEPGRHALTLYQLDDERADERARRYLGEDDYDYYQRRTTGTPWGCLMFVAALIVSFLKLWLVTLAVFAVWIAYFFLWWRTLARDS